MSEFALMLFDTLRLIAFTFLTCAVYSMWKGRCSDKIITRISIVMIVLCSIVLFICNHYTVVVWR